MRLTRRIVPSLVGQQQAAGARRRTALGGVGQRLRAVGDAFSAPVRARKSSIACGAGAGRAQVRAVADVVDDAQRAVRQRAVQVLADGDAAR